MRSFVAHQLDRPVLLHQLDDAQRVHRRVGPEGHAHQLGVGVDLHHAIGLGLDAQAVGVEQGLALGGQLAEAVGDLLEQAVELLGLVGRGQALVEVQRVCTSPQ
jgi:hypothetical protein